MLSKREREIKIEELKKCKFNNKFSKVINEINKIVDMEKADKWLNGTIVQESDLVLFDKKTIRKIFENYGYKITIDNMINSEYESVLDILHKVPNVRLIMDKLTLHGYYARLHSMPARESWLISKLFGKENYVISI